LHGGGDLVAVVGDVGIDGDVADGDEPEAEAIIGQGKAIGGRGRREQKQSCEGQDRAHADKSLG
jgi:hypothetical protein